MTDITQDNSVLKITFGGAELISEATKQAIANAIKDADASGKFAGKFAGVKLSILGNFCRWN
jgi:hypothetical protein